MFRSIRGGCTAGWPSLPRTVQYTRALQIHGKKLPKHRFTEFDANTEMCRIVGTAKGPAFYEWIHHETPYGFVLTVDHKPFALLGFDVGSDRVDLRQLQGRNKTEALRNPHVYEHLKGVNWSNLMLMTWLDWASRSGFREARILSAEGNPWYVAARVDLAAAQRCLANTECPSSGLRARVEKMQQDCNRFKIRYDTLAKRNGFDRVDENWYSLAI